MMKTPAARNLIAVIAAMLIAGPVAAANQVLVGSLDAVGDRPLSPGTAIAVSAESFTDLNTRLQPIIESVLAKGGYRIDPDATLKLTFETGSTDEEAGRPVKGKTEKFLDHVDIRSLDESRPPTNAPKDTFRSSDNDDYVYDSLDSYVYESLASLESMEATVSLELEGTTGHEDGRARHSLWFILGERGQPPSWQGSLRTPAWPQDPFLVLQRMVPVMVERMGEAARSEPVPIP